MKSIFTLSLLLTLVIDSFAQDNEYFRKIYSRPVGSKPLTTESLLKTFGNVRIINRWYVGADGFMRTDRNQITNNFDGLIGTESPTVSAWSVVAGWISEEQWSVEMEYARSAIHNMLVINGDNPLSYKLENDKNSLIIRGKRRLLFGKAGMRRSAFWISGGAGLIPNSNRESTLMEFYGYRERGRRQGVDTLSMISETQINPAVTGLVEVSAEYVVKVGRAIDVSLFARKQWGLGNSLTTRLVYTVNGNVPQQSTITGDGTGWNFGISLRYVFQLGYDFSALLKNP